MMIINAIVNTLPIIIMIMMMIIRHHLEWGAGGAVGHIDFAIPGSGRYQKGSTSVSILVTLSYDHMIISSFGEKVI